MVSKGAFEKPVTEYSLPTDEINRYNQEISEPMDFRTLLRNVEVIWVKFDFKEFLRQARLIWKNQYKFRRSEKSRGYNVYARAQMLEQLFEQMVIHMQAFHDSPDDNPSDLVCVFKPMINALICMDLYHDFTKEITVGSHGTTDHTDQGNGEIGQTCLYYFYIGKSMHYEKIIHNLDNEHYSSRFEILHDLNLIYSNATTFHDKNEIIYHRACYMKTIARRLFFDRDLTFNMESQTLPKERQNLSRLIDNVVLKSKIPRDNIFYRIGAICPESIIQTHCDTYVIVDAFNARQFKEVGEYISRLMQQMQQKKKPKRKSKKHIQNGKSPKT